MKANVQIKVFRTEQPIKFLSNFSEAIYVFKLAWDIRQCAIFKECIGHYLGIVDMNWNYLKDIIKNCIT